MKVLVSAASKYGATVEIANAIVDVLTERGFDTVMMPPEHVGTVDATEARDHRVFPGKLVKEQLSFPERAMALALRAQEGDFRDWDEIKRWASGIADALQT